MLTVQEAADLLRVTERTVLNYIRRKRLAAERAEYEGRREGWRISRASVEELKTRQKSQT